MESFLVKIFIPVLTFFGFSFSNINVGPDENFQEKNLKNDFLEIEKKAEEDKNSQVEKTENQIQEKNIGYFYGNTEISIDENYRYIKSNGIPNHEIGIFPNKANPNSISEQNHFYKVSLFPENTGKISRTRISGIALNGIPLEPATAEVENGFKKEAFDSLGMGTLGIDWTNAHVQKDGTYHYHAKPEGLLEIVKKDQEGDLVQVAWAADGFAIFYSLSGKFKPSYRVKDGERNGGPGGKHDGTYTEDWEFIEKLGDLDECNGVWENEKYFYVITDSYPYIQRCHFGTVDKTFEGDREVFRQRQEESQKRREDRR